MLLSSWLRFLPPTSIRTPAASRRNHRRPVAPRPSRFSLQVEVLEDRTVPSTLTVLNDLDSGAGSLRDTITHAKSGDSVIFDPRLVGQTITLTSGQVTIKKDLDIEGPGPNLLAISSNDSSRVFAVQKGQTVTIAGLTIAHGRADHGGGIFNETGANLIISNLTLANNQAVASTFAMGGGGALWNGGQASVNHCTFVSNQAPAAPGTGLGIGGAIENVAGTLVITESSFSGNQALTVVTDSDGGAIDNTDGHVAISDTTFTNNQIIGTAAGAEAIGGAVFNFDSTLLPGNKNPDPTVATMTLTNCTFTGNKALGAAGGDGITTWGPGLAGAIGNFGGTMIVSNSTVNNNQALGGTLAPGAPVISPATGEAATSAGGGLYSRFGILTIINSTFTGNQVIGSAGSDGGAGGSGGGGAISFDGSTATVIGCVFSGNSAMGGAGGRGAPGGYGDGGAIEFGAGINVGANARHVDAKVSITNSTFTDNLAVGGAGGSGARSGDGIGGAIAGADDVLLGQADASSLTLSGSTFSHNSATGGSGGAGGDGLGGALSFLGGASSITSTTLSDNLALGGDGGAGGNGFGGGIYVANGAALSVTGSTITYNRAQGGKGDHGSRGKGIGGGVYNLGTLSFDLLTVIAHNLASTSNDDVVP